MAVAGKDLLETEKREKGKLRQSRGFFCPSRTDPQ